MASALLASRNEPSWGERKVYMRKNPNSKPKSKLNPNPNANSNLNRFAFDPSDQIHVRHVEEPMAVNASVAASAASDDSSSLDRKQINGNRRELSIPTASGGSGSYVTYNLSALSRGEIRDLKKRLLAELDQVRSLTRRIDRDFQSRSGYSTSNFGGNGVREVNSIVPRPPQTIDPVPDKSLAPPRLSGNKRPLPLPPLRDLKRPVMDSSSVKAFSSMMKKCGQMLAKLMNHKPQWLFNSPVDAVALGLHDYHQIIKRPMDLGTVKSNLKKNFYATPLDFAGDVRLTFNNAMLYNPRGHEVHAMAEKLLSRFEKSFGQAYREFEATQRSLELEEAQRRSSQWPQIPPSIPIEISKKPEIPTPIVDPNPLQAPIPAPVAPAQSNYTEKKTMMVRSATPKQPKPKAKDRNKREMTFEEKQKLSMNLQDLPQEKMVQVADIIRRRNPNLLQNGEEIEIDFEAVDTETLWELDRFVCYTKKLINKMRRQMLSMAETVTVACGDSKKSPIHDAVEVLTEKNSKKGDAGEEDVDIGDEMPVTNYPPVEIEKDVPAPSSSSSSSDSDSSSSSDSDDSGSSSDTDSDGDEAQSPFVGSKAASPRT